MYITREEWNRQLGCGLTPLFLKSKGMIVKDDLCENCLEHPCECLDDDCDIDPA